MKYNELSVKKNASRKRVGRGISAGQGKTVQMGLCLERLNGSYRQAAEMFHKVISVEAQFLWLKV